MNYIKKFEELDFSQTLPYASASDLINYYECDCNALFKLLNKKVSRCPYCSSENVKLINREEWYKKVNDRLEEGEKEENNKIKSEEEENFIDITKLPINASPLSEGIGDTKSKKFWRNALGLFLSPISLSIFANVSTDVKIKSLKLTIFDNYIEEMAEYKILDEIKYDIKQPSKLNRIFRRLKMIKKRKDKYKTLEDYMNDGFKFLRLSNIINIRNREDLNYIIDEVREFFSKKTEEEWIQIALNNLRYSESEQKVVRIDKLLSKRIAFCLGAYEPMDDTDDI